MKNIQWTVKASTRALSTLSDNTYAALSCIRMLYKDDSMMSNIGEW